MLNNHIFTVILDMKNKDPKTLETEGIYMFLGRHWLITAHKSKVNLKYVVERLLKVKNKKFKEAQIDALYKEAWNNKGICRERMGDLDRAYECYLMGELTDKNNWVSTYNKGRILYKKEDYRAAIASYEINIVNFNNIFYGHRIS